MLNTAQMRFGHNDTRKLDCAPSYLNIVSEDTAAAAAIAQAAEASLPAAAAPAAAATAERKQERQ